MNRLLLLAPRIATNRLWARAGEVPSFHIAPVRTRDARDLITGSVLGTYNSASPAWAVGPDGVLFQPAANAPVIEYDPVTGACLGARIWGVVTNRIRNNMGVGAVPGTPGTLPTNWIINARGLTQTIIGTGTVNGINYIDIRLNGTTTSAGALEIKFDGNASITGLSASQSWAQSAWLAIIGGSTSNITNARLILNEYSAGPTYLRTAINASNVLSQGASLVRVGGVITTGASTTIGEPILLLDTAGSGVAINATFRIGLPQLEQSGTVGPVVPNNSTTLSASSTADVWTITGADFSRIWNQSAATMYAEATRDVVPAGDFPSVCGAYGTAFSDRIAIRYLTESIASFEVLAANIDQFICFPLVTTRTRRFAAASQTDNFAASFNGAAPLIDTSGTNPTVSQIFIGSNPNAQFLNGYIRELAIFRSRRPNANLQAMTQ